MISLHSRCIEIVSLILQQKAAEQRGTYTVGTDQYIDIAKFFINMGILQKKLLHNILNPLAEMKRNREKKIEKKHKIIWKRKQTAKIKQTNNSLIHVFLVDFFYSALIFILLSKNPINPLLAERIPLTVLEILIFSFNGRILLVAVSLIDSFRCMHL